MFKWRIVLLIPVLVTVWGTFTVLSSASTGEDPQRMYIGADKCRMCHTKKKQGEQYVKWQKGPHSKAYETLANEKSMEIAKAKGIDNPQEAPECLKCHTTGYGVDEKLLGPKFKIADGVGCESCHGPGADYYKMKTMKGVHAGEIEPQSVGLIDPNEKVCVGCHNEESPTYKPFDFATRVKDINHPIPKTGE